MKKLLLLAAFSLAAAGAFAQGNVNFANIGGGAAGTVNAIVRDISGGSPGVAAAGSAYAAMLYVGPAGAAASALTTNGVSGAPAAFNTGAQAGYFTGSSRVITGFPGGTTVTLQVRAWATATGANWETATTRGESATLQFTLGTPPATAPNMVGLQAFNVVGIVPEPSSIALGLLGLGAMALIRRRK